MTRPDILLVTVECARWDYRDHLRPDGDLAECRGVAAGHYTRPSVAALHAPTWDAVLDRQVRAPTLAGTLADAGYATHAISHSPQTTAAFGFDQGFGEARLRDPDSGPVPRGSRVRERLSSTRPVRWLHNQFGSGKQAVFEGIPTDGQVVARACDLLDKPHGPTFLWVHLMGTHRPYGWGEDAIDGDLSTALAEAGGGGLVQRDPEELRTRVEPAYVAALERTRDHLGRLLAAAGEDAVVAIAGDHGEELGEAGYFLHAGHRRRVVDTLLDVAVFTRGFAPDGPVSLIDLPAHLLGAAGVDRPPAWAARRGREHLLTVAPWDGRATVRYQAGGADLRFADATTNMSVAKVSQDVEEQLAALGYRSVG